MCEWIKQFNQKAKIGGLDKKVSYNYMLSVEDTLYIQRYK